MTKGRNAALVLSVLAANPPQGGLGEVSPSRNLESDSDFSPIRRQSLDSQRREMRLKLRRITINNNNQKSVAGALQEVPCLPVASYAVASNFAQINALDIELCSKLMDKRLHRANLQSIDNNKDSITLNANSRRPIISNPKLLRDIDSNHPFYSSFSRNTNLIKHRHRHSL